MEGLWVFAYTCCWVMERELADIMGIGVLFCFLGSMRRLFSVRYYALCFAVERDGGFFICVIRL